MGVVQKHNENYPPPSFHLNVNSFPNKRLPLSKDPKFNNNLKKEKLPSDNSNQSKKDNKKDNTKSINKYKESLKLDNNNEEEQNEKSKLKKNSKKNKKKKYDEKDSISIDIDIINKKNVKVKIPIKEDKYWEKEYNKNEVIGTILNDYSKQNKVNLPDDYFNEIECFNKKVSLQDKISSLLIYDGSNENYSNETNKGIDYINKNDIFPEIMGKPFNEPFEILCFYKKLKKFKVLYYNNELKEKTKINKFNTTSAYCNGHNHLYISGGENSLKKFWDINLNKNIIHEPIKIPPKKYHSMIFIPKNIVFIVGGNNSKTFYYNLKEKKLINWGELNFIRIEPSLYVVKNNLYCIDNINSNDNINNYSLEVTELDSKEGNWKLIRPKFSFDLDRKIFNQILFGVSKDNDDNIIFLGGKINDYEKNINKNLMNFMYNINNKTIELSKVKFKKFTLKDKAFCPFNDTYDYILTDFPRQSPQMVFFNKKKGKIEIINFSPDISYKMIDNNMIKSQNTENNEINKEINNENNSEKLSSDSPFFFSKDKNIDKNDMYISFHSEEKATDENEKLVEIRHSNKKNTNNIKPIIQQNNENSKDDDISFSKITPKFKEDMEYNNKLYINNKGRNTMLYNTKIPKINSNTNNFSKTPEKISDKLKNINVPNRPRRTINMRERNPTHSYDNSKKYYYPRKGLNFNREIFYFP